MKEQKKSRRQEILESLARMLESHPGSRITTAALAHEVGVSEAALYRHFPSKAKMFEGLINFIEETIISRVNTIEQEESDKIKACERILFLLTAFSERNPGISRILTGDALIGENEKLRSRISQFYDRLETHIKKILRDAETLEGKHFTLSVSACANLLLAGAEGRITQFVRSGFAKRPSQDWKEQVGVLLASIQK